ncbi:caveolin-2 [Corythoichthys intestinalis]|uniref:caveolin-2 n=1 Tax=Corythoichthys intestinalis TaxID=161448 RepID=UPI0025A59891|nr:caveolin-2 [Corythoichthys intestinalis]XP_061802407.1 caveolin-2 [Nerophis lumbriciformis]
MMMVSDDCMVEYPISDSGEDDAEGEEINTPPPPPEFASKTENPLPSAGPDTTPNVNRDPLGINQHLKVEVSDVLSAPAPPHHIDQMWLFSAVGFEKTRVWTYHFLSLFLAVPFAFLCGSFLAVLTCLHFWFVVPVLQMSNTFRPCLRTLCFCAVNIFIAPFCMFFALCCSHMALLVSSRDWHQMRDKHIV